MDVSSLMRQSVLFHRDRVAIVTEDRSLTFAQAWDRGVRLANGLRALGVEPGDRVASVEDNNLGAAIAGAVRVPLYARNARHSHAEMVEQTQAKVVLADATYADSVAGLTDELPDLRTVLVRDAGYEDWLAAQSDVDPEVDVGGDAWYIIRHSAGTTGRSKGVGYTQHDWLVNCRNWYYRLPNLTPDSVVGHAGPISHASGYLFLPAWLHGSTNLLFGAFDVHKVLDLVVRHRVTHMFAPPSMVAALAAEPTARDGDFACSSAARRSPTPPRTPAAPSSATCSTRCSGRPRPYRSIMSPDEWFSDVPGSTPMRAAGRVLPFAASEEATACSPIPSIGRPSSGRTDVSRTDVSTLLG